MVKEYNKFELNRLHDAFISNVRIMLKYEKIFAITKNIKKHTELLEAYLKSKQKSLDINNKVNSLVGNPTTNETLFDSYKSSCNPCIGCIENCRRPVFKSIIDRCGGISVIRKFVKGNKHIIEEGSRNHVVSYDDNGIHCSDENCEINKNHKGA